MAELNIDDDTFPVFANPVASASRARAWSVGLNWYLNRNVRVNASFSHTTFIGWRRCGNLRPAIVTRQPENVLFTRDATGVLTGNRNTQAPTRP